MKAKYGTGVVGYADGLMKELDKNGDQLLTPDEWKVHKWSETNPIENSDTDKNDIISFEELCVRILATHPEYNEKTVPGAPVTITVTPNSIIVSSDDLDALDDIEEMLSQLIEVETDPLKRLHKIHLRYIKADNAAALIQEILSGGASAGEGAGGGGGSLMGDMMMGMMGGNPLGGLLGGPASGGGATSTTGVTIVADPQRNDIWVTATNRDLDRVQDVLKSIDRPPSEEYNPNSAPRYIC